jgi:hypothetical protein
MAPAQPAAPQNPPAASGTGEMSNSLAKMFAGTKLNDTATEFVPTGMMASTKEQFPDLDALDSEPKKNQTKKQKKKNKKMVSHTQKEEDEENASLPHKGKPSDFFMLSQKEDGQALNPMLNPYNYDMSPS